MTDDPGKQPAILTVEQMDQLLTRLDALDILVQRLVHICGQVGPGAFEFLVAPPSRQVPPSQVAYNDRVAEIIAQIVSRERASVEANKQAGKG